MKLYLRFLILFLPNMLGLLSVRGQTVETFTTSGSWTVPCGVTTATIEIWGGGGAGGGDGTNGFPAGSGGGSGAYVRYVNLPVVAGNIYNFTIGAGGTGVLAGTGGNGGATTFNGPGAALTASGGNGGGVNGGAGGTGGATATGGTTNTVGNNGQTSLAGHTSSGFGAGAPNGGGNVSGCSANGCTGTLGSVYGGGGSGGGPRGGGSSSTGGAGRNGAVIITYTSTVTVPNAGPDQNFCAVSYTMAGNAPDPGWTGTWTCVSGCTGVTITAPNSPTTSVTGIGAGVCTVLRWTFSQAGCSSMSDDITVCRPVVCNDDPCNATPLTVNTSCSYTVYSSTGATVSSGMVQPGCGSFDQSVSEDVWFSAVVPANGELFVQGYDDNGTAGNYLVGMAVYSGTCGNLMQQGCDFTTSTLAANAASIVYNGTPGETVYIRVWDFTDATGSFNICAYTHANATGTVFPGNTTITCGGPAQTWMDPGGTGNYATESAAYYRICPSAPGQYVTVSFSSFALETGFDFLTVMNGGTGNSPIIANLTGGTIPATITSSASDGCLSFAFRSDNLNTFAGWVASISCTSVAGTNTPICTSTNCAGNCGEWVCADGLYPADNQGSASVEELSEEVGGCFGGIGEISTKWFYFTALTTGTIGITLDGPGGQDYDFAVWGPSATSGVPDCPTSTGNGPIRCSYSAAANPVGLGNGATDYYEDGGGDGWVAPLDVVAGETYVMLLNIFQNGNPQPTIDISFSGTGTLDCTPLPVTLAKFTGEHTEGYNRLQWETFSEINNLEFTLYYGADAVNWNVLNTQPGAMNSNVLMQYAYSHISPYNITYYKLRQTDIDGQFEEFGPISVSKSSGGSSLVMQLYPNPASDQLRVFISSSSSNPLTLMLTDNLGRIMLEYPLQGNGMHLVPVELLPRGIYFLQVQSEWGIERVEKVVLN